MDIRKIKKLIDLMIESDLQAIEVKEGDQSIALTRRNQWLRQLFRLCQLQRLPHLWLKHRVAHSKPLQWSVFTMQRKVQANHHL